jgi:hypothetical protein
MIPIHHFAFFAHKLTLECKNSLTKFSTKNVYSLLFVEITFPVFNRTLAKVIQRFQVKLTQ